MSRQQFLAIFSVIGTGLSVAQQAHALQPAADCGGWAVVAQWERRGVFIDATASLEQLTDGVFVAVDTSHASSWAAAGGELLLSAPWSFTLTSGETYRVRLSQVVYDHALTAPATTALVSWTAADRYSMSWTGSPFTCSSGRPSLSVSTPLSATRGQQTVILPLAVVPPGWSAPLHFSLASAPASMSIDGVSGEIHWTPNARDVGKRAVIVALESGGEVLDVAGLEIPVAASALSQGL